MFQNARNAFGIDLAKDSTPTPPKEKMGGIYENNRVRQLNEDIKLLENTKLAENTIMVQR